MPCNTRLTHAARTPRHFRHSRTARRDTETPVAMGTVAALSGHHRCRSTQQQSACCAAFRGICGAGAPAPCTTRRGKDVRAHDASTAWSAGCRKGGTQLGIYASAFDRQTGQHQSSCSPFTAQFTAVISSHQSSSFITFEASSEACIVSCACLVREAWPQR